jgi:hypothetical protein
MVWHSNKGGSTLLGEAFFHPGLSNGYFICAYLTPLQMEY